MFLEITPRNVLSFGPNTPPIELKPLNVLIGPNGSGKSNLIEVIALMRATPGDVRDVVRRGGGVQQWIWKGQPDEPALIDVVISNPSGNQPLRHVFTFAAQNQAFALIDERVENRVPYEGHHDAYFFYKYQDGAPVIRQFQSERPLARDAVEPNVSVVAQRRESEIYPQIYHLGVSYERARLYREWQFGRQSALRQPQQADMRNDRLEEDFSNLGLFLNRLRRHPQAKRAVLDHVRDLYDGVSDFDVSVEGGTVQVFLTEGDYTIPATRLSDGTLRYLCLLAILCDPTPPPLVCIEEPELGLHPDILPKLADLLVEASARMQLIVTTHSEVLVDALTETPEAIIVCEKHNGQTEMRRLDRDDLAVWLEKYRLGDLWLRGQLGGVRW